MGRPVAILAYRDGGLTPSVGRGYLTVTDSRKKEFHPEWRGLTGVFDRRNCA